jgi:hypothetical protein
MLSVQKPSTKTIRTLPVSSRCREVSGGLFPAIELISPQGCSRPKEESISTMMDGETDETRTLTVPDTHLERDNSNKRQKEMKEAMRTVGHKVGA